MRPTAELLLLTAILPTKALKHELEMGQRAGLTKVATIWSGIVEDEPAKQFDTGATRTRTAATTTTTTTSTGTTIWSPNIQHVVIVLQELITL